MIKEQCAGFLNTEPLWEGKQFDIQQFKFPDLDIESYFPKIIPQNIRLGHQMEYIFKQLVEYSGVYTVAIYNLPIREEKRTLGEIDFVLKDNSTGKLIHVELTYKFYIIDPDISDQIHRLMGPNKRDKFFLKMGKIKNVQFPLLHSVEGAQALQSINIDHTKIEHQCCFKAQLFQPYGHTEINIGPLNRDCLVGYWLPLKELNKSEFENSTFYIPSKSEWVIQPHDQVNWKSHSEIIVDIKVLHLEEYAPMIWIKRSQSIIEKCFVVWW